MTGKSPTKTTTATKTTRAAAASTARSRPASTGRKAAARPRLTYLIGSLDRILRRKMTEALAPLGLTLAQFTALSVLEARGEASNAQLAERSFITPQSANEVMSVMASRNWITREPDPNHGRIVVLRLTNEGRQVLNRCKATVHVLETQMLSGIEAHDASAAQDLLELFVRNLRE
ncbi:MarR family transcriptional regulator [Paraburkholderia sp. BL10I2N1]|uniref:MarR family winged helix-turn-helix transcriptional regulator n=1 Tax=Paraburkholderia sp. BL10I2N1 TaxID=1938796 RepID=UPI00105BB37D|nr:MarR family transcriptional regulator [Paraburkholderia sp. BL10I2N1]TDN70124.1 MarR family transcriptional regulator [Paraburkholderia sp. BL10I2N1]